jgi:hypothetical protein
MRVTVPNEIHCSCLTCVRATERATYSQTKKNSWLTGIELKPISENFFKVKIDRCYRLCETNQCGLICDEMDCIKQILYKK